jgi:hypothetical protein
MNLLRARSTEELIKQPRNLIRGQSENVSHEHFGHLLRIQHGGTSVNILGLGQGQEIETKYSELEAQNMCHEVGPTNVRITRTHVRYITKPKYIQIYIAYI